MDDTDVERVRPEAPGTPKPRKLKLEGGGTAIIRWSKVNRLVHTPPASEDRTTLRNPYPTPSEIERWNVIFEYGENYNITKNCYNTLRKEMLAGV